MPLTVWKCSTSKNVAIALSIIIREARTELQSARGIRSAYGSIGTYDVGQYSSVS